MNTDPVGAPARTDLPFLTTRSRPRSVAAPRIDYVRRTPRPTQPVVEPPGTATDDLLDLSPPTPSIPAPAAPAPVVGPSDNLLDLSPPAPTAAPPAPIAGPPDNLLDLSTPNPTAVVAEPKPVAAQAPSIHPVRRIVGDDREILPPTRPTLALTRVQSGIGRIGIELLAPSTLPVGLAVVYTDADGDSHVVDPTNTQAPAPVSTSNPLITSSSAGFGSFGLNLRRARWLRRLIVVALSRTGGGVEWTGTLAVSTFGGGRIDIPLDPIPTCATTICASVYNVDGEYVLRAEGQPMNGSLREASRSFGFDTVSWLDGRTPIS